QSIEGTNNQSPDLAHLSSTRPPGAPGQIFSTTTGAQIDAGHRGFDFRHFWHTLIEKLWVVVLCVVAGLFLGLGYIASTPKLYQGHVVLQVELQEPTLFEDSAARSRDAFWGNLEAMRTIEQTLFNRSLLARVIRSGGLANDGGRAFLGPSAKNLAAKASPASSPSTDTSTGNSAQASASYTPLEEAMAARLSRMVRPVIRKGTRLIDLSVTNHDPVIAQRLTEAVGREYIRSSI